MRPNVVQTLTTSLVGLAQLETIPTLKISDRTITTWYCSDPVTVATSFLVRYFMLLFYKIKYFSENANNFCKTRTFVWKFQKKINTEHYLDLWTILKMIKKFNSEKRIKLEYLLRIPEHYEISEQFLKHNFMKFLNIVWKPYFL